MEKKELEKIYEILHDHGLTINRLTDDVFEMKRSEIIREGNKRRFKIIAFDAVLPFIVILITGTIAITNKTENKKYLLLLHCVVILIFALVQHIKFKKAEKEYKKFLEKMENAQEKLNEKKKHNKN